MDFQAQMWRQILGGKLILKITMLFIRFLCSTVERTKSRNRKNQEASRFSYLMQVIMLLLLKNLLTEKEHSGQGGFDTRDNFESAGGLLQVCELTDPRIGDCDKGYNARDVSVGGGCQVKRFCDPFFTGDFIGVRIQGGEFSCGNYHGCTLPRGYRRGWNILV
mmetsp:Transcript_10549/g.12032  ORF Transcript_10549/g.12032 Transcript_10549/m.12032 type:complete len:163 (+) Transcript_10549:475-963(+)